MPMDTLPRAQFMKDGGELMFRRNLVPVWIGIILLSGMFLMGQDTWAPQECIDNDGDGYGNPASESCPNSGWDCNENNPEINPGVIEGPYGDPLCNDGGDNDCDGFSDSFDSGCWWCAEPEDCADGNPCTDDACEGGSCVYTNNTGPCDDGDACTLGDVCSNGTCSGTLDDQDDDGYADIPCGGNDCDDTNADVHPGAPELCDGIDNQCPGDAGYGHVDEGCILLPDTGITQCYDNTSVIDCPAPGQPFYGQDAQHATNPMSFTVNPDGQTVRDNVTGLMWQREDDDTTRTWADAISHCEGLPLAGYADWRLPNIYELQSIVDYSQFLPAIDPEAFPGTKFWYWSSTSSLNAPFAAWAIYFYNGGIWCAESTPYVRCVRGEEILPSTFTDNTDGTVTDNATYLMWQRQDDDVPRTWEEALSYCQTLEIGDYYDWQLPNEKELTSIVDYTHWDPTIDEDVFPGAFAGGYWSSSTYTGSPSLAWGTYFNIGFNFGNSKSVLYHVRCVR